MAEDFEPDATLVQLTLKRAGVLNPVFVVENGDDALAYLAGNGRFADRVKFPFPGVLLLDLKMPRTNGFEVLDWIKGRSQFPGLLVVVLSGVSDLAQVNRAYAAGAHSFLVKPCNEQDIANLAKSFAGPWSFAPPVG